MGFIGVVDSGVGGLTILQKLVSKYSYNFVYIADHAFCPYGRKSNDVVYSRARSITSYLQSQGAQAVVLACNTISVYADKLQREFNIPIYNVITPTCKYIIKNNFHNVALLATRASINNGAYQKKLSKFGIKVTPYDCSSFVPYAEQRATDTLSCQREVYDVLHNLSKNKYDAVILGCTHFPLLRNQISYYCGDAIIVECVCDLPTEPVFNSHQTVQFLTTGDEDFANNAASWYDGGKAEFKKLYLS